ncbi:methyltransferase family protein [Thalassospira sp. CH_XMU1448-2]|uniref:methyltransferase family protein n=1 Tax=Thalassospira sp. CH_XMU1448-2 TaxID=3107773 RepID=UPI00300BE26E
MLHHSTGTVSAPRQALSLLQRRRKLVIAGLAILLLGTLPLVQSLAKVQMSTHELVEVIGICLIVLAILGRGWCTLYIGGRKARQLTDTGPYSISRNPLYVFSFIGAAGIGAQTGSLVISLVFVLGAIAVFLPVTLREERALAQLFGPKFDAYRARVPRFGPRFSTWKDMDALEVRPKLLWRTLRDGLVFFLAVPLFELFDWLQVNGIIHPFIHLP